MRALVPHRQATPHKFAVDKGIALSHTRIWLVPSVYIYPTCVIVIHGSLYSSYMTWHDVLLQIMTSLLPPAAIPFAHVFPSFMPPLPTAPPTLPLTDMQQKITPSAPPTPRESPPLLSAASKTSEAHFTFGSNRPSSVSNQQSKQKEKYACKYCGKVGQLLSYERC